MMMKASPVCQELLCLLFRWAWSPVLWLHVSFILYAEGNFFTLRFCYFCSIIIPPSTLSLPVVWGIQPGFRVLEELDRKRESLLDILMLDYCVLTVYMFLLIYLPLCDPSFSVVPDILIESASGSKKLD